MKNLTAILAVGFAFCAATANALPISQVSVITLGGPTYRDDQWTLNLTSPIAASLTYTVTSDDEVGANSYNVTQHWGAAINSNSTLSGLLTATYFIWDGVTIDNKYNQITLTADVPGIPFTASVSVFEACNCNNNETTPLSVSIVTTTEAYADPVAVPEPSSLAIFFGGLVGLSALHRRRRSALTKSALC